MNRKCQSAFWLLVLSASWMLACGVNEEDYDAGVEAYANGDFQTAMAKFRPLAEHGHAAAQTSLGVIYYQGQGVPADYPEAVKWYKLAAAQGYSDALYNMGIAYAEGKGVEKNAQEALRWYRMAGDAGHSGAQFLLGDVYSRGVGVDQDEVEAARWYLAAAERGHGAAQVKVAGLYASGGHGLPLDLTKAHMWYYIAASQDDPAIRTQAETARRRASTGEMDDFEIAESERLAREWLARFRENSRNP